MLKVKSLGSNKTLVKFANGNEIFVSYSTPVAAKIDGLYYRTSQYWSNTTSRHVNAYLDGVNATEKSQSWFDQLLNV